MSNDKKAGFSDVVSRVDSTAGVASRADFSDVSATVGSTAQVAGEQTYTVQKGDSLSRIAKNLLGDANAWTRIFQANRDVLQDPDRIQPGQTLKIPPRQE